MRLHQLLCRRVDVSEEALRCDAPLSPRCVPHHRHRVAKCLVGEHPFEQCPEVPGTATSEGNVVAQVVGGEVTVVIVEGIIEVPYRSHVEMLIASLFREVAAPEGIGIACQLLREEVLQEACLVEL